VHNHTEQTQIDNRKQTEDERNDEGKKQKLKQHETDAGIASDLALTPSLIKQNNCVNWEGNGSTFKVVMGKIDLNRFARPNRFD